MKRLSYILTFFLLTVGVFLWGCTDEFSYPDKGGVEELYDGIVLRVPDASTLSASMTRAGDDLDEDAIALAKRECLLSELYLIAFPENTDNDPVIVDVFDSRNIQVHENSETHAGYTDYVVTDHFRRNGKILSGKWVMYVVANLSHYLTNGRADIENIKKESDLTDLKLNFYGKEGDEYLLSSAFTGINGLPMACLPAEMMYKNTTDKNLTQATGGLVPIEQNGKGVIHADLTFLCSKVRYTLLFDNETYSQSMFADMSFALDKVGVKNLPADGSAIDGPVAGTTLSRRNCNGFRVTEYQYPLANADKYPEEDDLENSLPSLDKGAAAPFKQRAFQGVIYMPENIASDGGDEASALSFKAHVEYLASGERSNGTNLDYTMSLLPSAVEGSKEMKRGHSYDIVAYVKNVETLELHSFNVKQWTPVSLLYTLRLPAYLHVKETDIPVTAGQTTEMWYESNVEIKGESPLYEGKPLYTFDTSQPNNLKIKVNPDISSSAFADIDKTKYNYFHIVAGTIHKKIDVTPLLLQRFLTVEPRNITIDAREKIAGGIYESGNNESEYYHVTIETNVDKFYMEDLTWKSSSPGNNVTIYKIVNGTEQQLDWSSDNGRYTIYTGSDNGFKNGTMQLRIKYSGVNSGVSFWNESRELSFRVYTDNDGLQPGNEDYIAPKTVAVTTRPNSDSYTIYFKAPAGWTDPHIYVYQCLELPATIGTRTIFLNNDHNNGQTTMNLSSYPVGYEDDGSEVAALEYSFTGATIFKGWEYPTNRITDSKISNGYYHNGFFMFQGANVKTCDWNPTVATDRYYKGPDVDFCYDYRMEHGCDNCKNYEINASWPGIRMEYVEEGPNKGWYRFELSGVATPGKALIMFTDTHPHGYDVANRYPLDKQVGVPLFDFPNREGWFDWETKAFMSSRE